MLVIIKKDDATSVPREVADMAAARALAISCAPMQAFIEGDSTPIALTEPADEAPAEPTADEAPPVAQEQVEAQAEPAADAAPADPAA